MILLNSFLQFNNHYERYAYDAISVLFRLKNSQDNEDDISVVDQLNNISFMGASVSTILMSWYFPLSILNFGITV